MDIPENILKTLQTERDIVHIKDIIFSYVKFETQEFNNILNQFKKLSLRENDDAEFTLNWQNINIDYGLGGIHAAPRNTIIESNDKYIIKSFDAKSYYPHLIFQNDLCPAHLPKEIFIPLYKGFYDQRIQIPATDPWNYILKIILNSVYGLTNDKFSFLKDRLVTLATCINGQLLLSMLVEKLTTHIPDSQLIMMNTDGAEVLIPRKYEKEFSEICKWWEELTKIPLETVDYQKMIIRDVDYLRRKPFN